MSIIFKGYYRIWLVISIIAMSFFLGYINNIVFAASLLDVDFDTKTLTSPLATSIAGYSADSTNNTFNTAFTEGSGNKCTKFLINSTTSDYIMLNGANRPETYISGNVKFSFDFKAGYNSGSTKHYFDLSIDNITNFGIRADYINKSIKNSTTGTTFANTSGSGLSFDVWQHFEIQFDTVNSNCNIYIDGVKANSSPISVAYSNGNGIDFGRLTVYGTPGTVNYVDNLKLYNIDNYIELTGGVGVGGTLKVYPDVSNANYEWQRCDSISGSYSVIAGANTQSYYLNKDDSEKYIRAKVTKTDNSASYTSTSVGPIESNLANLEGVSMFTSNSEQQGFSVGFAFDYMDTTRWVAGRDAISENTVWLQINTNGQIEFDTIQINEYESRINEYQIQYSNDNAHWTTAYSSNKVSNYLGTGKSNVWSKSFLPCTAKYIRLNISKSETGKYPSIKEIRLSKTGNAIPPKAQNIVLSGATAEGGLFQYGDVVKANYSYSQEIGVLEGNSIYKWLIADNLQDNNWQEILSGTTKADNTAKPIFAIQKDAINKYLKFEIIPYSIWENGMIGEVVSSIIGPIQAVSPKAPVANEIAVNGIFYEDNEITGTYKYTDLNEDKEAETKYMWVRASKTDATVWETVEQGTAKSTDIIKYKLKAEDANNYLKLIIIPVAEKSPFEGQEASSNANLVRGKPVAKNVWIWTSANIEPGATLEGIYDYYHPNGYSESTTIYKWYKNYAIIQEATNKTYTVKETDVGATITFGITPQATNDPKIGHEVISQGVNVSNKKIADTIGSSFGGSSPKGFTGIVALPVVEQNQEKIEPKNKLQKQFEDIDNHWAKDYIVYLNSKGIVNGVNDKEFFPDENVTRAEFVSIIVRALGLNPAIYKSMVADIQGSEWYAGYVQQGFDWGFLTQSDLFRPNSNITREEMTKIVVEAFNVDKSGDSVLPFEDKDDISGWALPYIKAAYKNGIIKGFTSTTVGSKENTTRAQAAALLARLLDK